MKRPFAVCALQVLLLVGAAPAAAQGGSTGAEPHLSGSVREPPTGLAPLATAAAVGPAPSASTDRRPARGPAMRERGGRRTRASSSATGFLMIVVFVAFVGYYVLKKIRRH